MRDGPDLRIVRWQQLSGKEAVLESTGETFAITTTTRQGESA